MVNARPQKSVASSPRIEFFNQMSSRTSVNHKTLRWALVAVAGICQFLAALFYAAKHYPNGYFWYKHFISDLGRTVTSDGIDNSANTLLFSASSLVLGLMILPFLLVLPTAFTRGGVWLRILGVLTVLGLIGIGQTPYDVYFFAHHAFLFLWIIPMLLMALGLSVVMFLDGCTNLSPFLMSGLLSAGSTAYACMDSHYGFVVMQKLVVFLSLIWFYVMLRSVVVVTKWVPSERQRIIDAQAVWYASRYRRATTAIRQRP